MHSNYLRTYVHVVITLSKQSFSITYIVYAVGGGVIYFGKEGILYLTSGSCDPFELCIHTFTIHLLRVYPLHHRVFNHQENR